MSAAPAHRTTRVLRRLRQEPAGVIAQRVVRRLHDRLVTADLDFPLRRGDVADSTRVATGRPSPRPEGPLTIGWLSTPPGEGSGGHTTMFRMIRALEAEGHRCVLVLYDRNGGDVTHHRAVVRGAWPWVDAEVRSADEGFAGLDACVATSWQTAHVLAARTETLDLHRLYFVQDFEPYFYPRGSDYELAADSYRFGFQAIALGRMVQERLLSEVGVEAAVVPFSADTDVYRLQHRGPRSGVVFYAKPGVPRRGYRLAVLALEEFHRRRPDHPIHVYGHDAADIEAPVVRHHRLSPEQLNDLYNASAAGIALSFTNISLVTEEMLASGCLPVVNDSPDARADLDNPHVRWARPTPGALADALCRAVDDARDGRAAVAAAESIRPDSWTVAGAGVARIIERTVRGERPVERLRAVGDGS